MEEQTQEESVQPQEPSESLKPFSDVELLDELRKRLLSNPKVDPQVLERLQTTVSELQERERVKSDIKPEGITEAASSVEPTKPESSVESEGKKWAKIIREKGVGSLNGKFRKEWRYLQEGGNFCSIVENSWIGFRSAGVFGYKDKSEGSLAQGVDPEGSSLIERIIHRTFAEEIRITRNESNRANLLSLQPLDSKYGRFCNGLFVCYVSWLSRASCPDGRGGVGFKFSFVLPEKEKVEFLAALTGKYDLIEDIFQNVYPGLTGENGAKRMEVDKLSVITPDIKPYPAQPPRASFSRLVGEMPWGERGENF